MRSSPERGYAVSSPSQGRDNTQIERPTRPTASPGGLPVQIYALLRDAAFENEILRDSATNTYTIDEKGFFISVVKRSKRLFTKALWASKEARTTVQDSNTEWSTLLVCVCVSGEAPPSALVHPGVFGIQSGWVDTVEAHKHQVFLSHSVSSGTNDEMELSWLQNVFHRIMRERAARDYRLLLLDGHSSHVARECLEYCDAHRVLRTKFFSHATHSFQPLDVVVFAPLERHYSSELDGHLQRPLGLTRVQTRDFFALFWAAWGTTRRQDLIPSQGALKLLGCGRWMRRLCGSASTPPLRNEMGVHKLGTMATATNGVSSEKFAQMQWRKEQVLTPNVLGLHFTEYRLETSVITRKTRPSQPRLWPQKSAQSRARVLDFPRIPGIEVVFHSGIPGVYKLPGSARPRNKTKLSRYNSRKAPKERSRRRRQHIKNPWLKRQRRSDSVSVGTSRWRRKRGLRKPPARRSSNPNYKLSQH